MRPFLYTLDQISTVLAVPEPNLRERYIHFDGRSVGVQPKARMLAVNLAEPDQTPDWRVTEGEFIRWMRSRGLRYYERGWVT